MRNIKSMWEKGNVQSSPTSPTPTVPKAELKVTDGAVWGWGPGDGGIDSGVRGLLLTKAWRKRWSTVEKSVVGKLLRYKWREGKKRGLWK